MKIIFLTILLFVLQQTKAQVKQPLSELITQIGDQWKKDSNSCNGYRFKAAKQIKEAKNDGVTKETLLLKLGKPNEMEKFYDGVKNRNFISYTYYIYKDDCPKMILTAIGIQFLFYESDSVLINVTEIDYCG